MIQRLGQVYHNAGRLEHVLRDSRFPDEVDRGGLLNVDLLAFQLHEAAATQVVAY